MSPASLHSALKDRSQMLEKARSFFYERGLDEVDCPALSKNTSVDEHIDLIQTTDGRFLFSSPEYGMKRLLAAGMGDIFQLSHVYRAGERGFKHREEFMMAEWYRLGASFQEMIDETLKFIRLFVGDLESVQATYQELFLRTTGLDPLKAPLHDLKHFLGDYPESIEDDRDALLNLILATRIESQLPHDKLFVLTHYPATQSALAKCVGETAERFEVYSGGLELCNGYHECTDPKELRGRLLESNRLRLKNGKEELPLDEEFLRNPIPDCSGVAVGFDRLMMLRLEKKNISEVILDL